MKIIEQIKKMKKHPVVIIISLISGVIIYLAQFTNAFQDIHSFLFNQKKSEPAQKNISMTQKIEKSPGSIQAGRDINIKVEQNKIPSTPPPTARFPFDLQVHNTKERIRYLSQEYLHTDTLSLTEVIGAYGDNVLDSPQLYDWHKVMDTLAKQGYIKIQHHTNNNIEFKVLPQMAIQQKKKRDRDILHNSLMEKINEYLDKYSHIDLCTERRYDEEYMRQYRKAEALIEFIKSQSSKLGEQEIITWADKQNCEGGLHRIIFHPEKKSS